MVREIKLNNGYTIPIIGLGTWKCDKKVVSDVVKAALDVGYRHIDTAAVYGNEKEIGEALLNHSIPRNEIFLTSKLWNSSHDNPNLGLEITLKNLKTDYLDLYYIHWPVNFENNNGVSVWRNGNPVLKTFELEKVYRNMENFVKNGKIKSIGVSNFGIGNIRKILEFCEIKPAMLQIEFHPYLQQNELIDFCKQNKICITAYSSLGSTTDEKNKNIMRVRDDPVIQRISREKKISPSTVILSWITSKDIVVIPKSTKEDHLKENLMLVELSNSEIIEIDSLSRNFRYVDPENFGPDRFK
ncbi:Aldose reductase [Dictyocoela muelleri]|nr:Aldose reductase [Dictyocoela muelleri]